jgi:glycosyltransferase involved in cell wall biosynthesis
MPSVASSRLLTSLIETDDIVTVIRSAERACESALIERWRIEMLDPLVAGDDLAATAAVYLAAHLDGGDADGWLTERLGDPGLAGHAASALSARSPVEAAVPRLVGLVGGPDPFDAMLAQRTLVGWGRTQPDQVGLAVDTALVFAGGSVARGRLVTTLGELPGSRVATILERIASDTDEPAEARIAAVAALGFRPGDDAVLYGLIDDDDLDVETAALLAIGDRLGLGRAPPARPAGVGLRVAQLSLQGGADPALLAVGAGDQGGVNTLLVLAARALSRRADVAHVLSIGRGTPSDAVATLLMPDDGNVGTAAVAVDATEADATPLAMAWDRRVALARSIDRILATRPPFDLLHVRMADVGTLAAAAVARRRGLPLVFSLAPDPHAVVRSLQMQGRLDRARFGELDRREHVWFRARMVERLARNAAALALFPRPEIKRTLHELVGIDLDDDATAPSAIVPEGVDLGEIDAIAARPRRLDPALESLPDDRRDLPWLLVVGRLAPVKGVARVVQAWAGDDALHATRNLLVVGGELAQPSRVEASVLAEIVAAADDGAGRCRPGLVLLGRRPHDETIALLVDAAARGGVLVSGSLKEEFGLAIVEALAAGLTVVAPATGGPATYVADGDTGVLVAADQPLGPAILRAVDLVDRPQRAERARATIEAHHTVESMAERLVELYRRIATT